MTKIDIEELIRELSKGPEVHNPDGLPVIPPLPEPIPGPADGAVAICGQCGMRITSVMGLGCPNARCPVFVKVTC